MKHLVTEYRILASNSKLTEYVPNEKRSTNSFIFYFYSFFFYVSFIRNLLVSFIVLLFIVVFCIFIWLYLFWHCTYFSDAWLMSRFYHIYYGIVTFFSVVHFFASLSFLLLFFLFRVSFIQINTNTYSSVKRPNNDNNNHYMFIYPANWHKIVNYTLLSRMNQQQLSVASCIICGCVYWILLYYIWGV